jgi:hypothetical protein
MTCVDVIQCASDESIEAYSLGKVTDELELEAIEEHLLVCHACQDRLTDADVYTKAIRAALSSFHIEAVEMQAVHVTGEGVTYLWATECERGLWTARISGCEAASGHVFTSCTDAFAHNALAFCTLFPRHTCSAEFKQIGPQ